MRHIISNGYNLPSASSIAIMLLKKYSRDISIAINKGVILRVFYTCASPATPMAQPPLR
jgi:hypothetical protein